MGQPLKKSTIERLELVTGQFSKKDAAHFISSGTRHVYSSPTDALATEVKLTEQFLKANSAGDFKWETHQQKIEHILRSSSERYEFIQSIVKREGIGNKRDLRERFETTVEELLTNAIYHSYQDKNGGPRYSRRDSVALPDADAIHVIVAHDDTGVFLKVKDQGGSLRFDDISKAFARCYSGGEQIEEKEGGAGLGIYMVFESVSHLKIVCEPGKSTAFSCWLASHHEFNPEQFSFNYFERR